MPFFFLLTSHFRWECLFWDPGLLQAHLKDEKTEERTRQWCELKGRAYLFRTWSPHLNSMFPEGLESVPHHSWREINCL